MTLKSNVQIEKITIVSYRKLSFAKAFGFTVRDLMFLKALDNSSSVALINWFERPNSGPEILKNPVGELGLSEKVVRHRRNDFSILGPLREGRGWTSSAFRLHETQLDAAVEPLGRTGRSVLLDFNPFYIPPLSIVSRSFYWYDMIDTFTLHNRFTPRQIDQVRRKYEFVERYADRVTGVTQGSVAQFSKGMVVPNRLLQSDWQVVDPEAPIPDFDFGFLGFITDKMDLDLLHRLGNRGYRIFMAGMAYDKATLKQLLAVPNLHYHGRFSAREAPALTRKFKIGLVPYRPEKMHNESPIKFFQYVAAGRPSLMSARFNDMEDYFAEYIHQYSAADDAEIDAFVHRMTEDFDLTQKAILSKAMSRRELFWESSLADILSDVVA